MRKRKKSCNWIVVLILILLLSISIGYSALSSTLSIGGLVTISLPQVYPVKYAVQIYGINQDVDADGNPLGLTFGPATEFELNNAYITHTYEETSPGSNIYNVVRVLHHVAANNTETFDYGYLYKNGGSSELVTRTAAEKEKYDVNIHNMTWTEIANTTDKSVFLDCMLCGDTKSVTYNLNNKIASGETYDQYGDGTGTLYKAIKPYYRMWNPSYNSTEYPERNNAAAINSTIEGTNARNAGGYSSSHIRATLIGQNSKTDVRYAGDVNLSESNSLFSCIAGELKNLITSKRVRYVTGTDEDHYTRNEDIVDKIWLFSPREVFGDSLSAGITTEGLGTQGVGYDRFANNESRYYISSYTNGGSVGRHTYQENEQPISWWLRAPSLYYDSHPIIVEYGGITCSPAFSTVDGSIAVGFCLQGEYTVSFNSNGGTGTLGNQTIANNVPTALSANSFTKNSYVFAGWNTKADGSGTSYSDGQAVTNLGNITLYAQWKKPTNYAVQIYGINEDVDASGNPIGLSFGPATGDNYNNKYITHDYEETSAGSGVYRVKIITHTVASNGSESTTSEYLYKNGGTTEYVTRTEAEKNKYNINMHNMTWAQIVAVNDKTSFLDCMLCGDTKKVELALNNTIGPDMSVNQYGDGAGILYDVINPYYRIWNPAYNNSEAFINNSAVGTGVSLSADELNGGSNARFGGTYSSSHLRATLVGADAKTNIGYAGDVNLTEANSLYSCLPSSLKNVITAKKVKYATGYANDPTLNNDITDKIWAFSPRELYGTAPYSGETLEGLGNDGHGYGRFGNVESRYYMPSYSDNSINSRTCYNEGGAPDFWLLRSATLDYDFGVAVISADGYMNGSHPSQYIFGISFGFCIE